VTGYSGIGVYCNTILAALLTETSCSRGFREDILPTLCSPPALSEGLPTAVQYNKDAFILFTDQGPTDHLGIEDSYLPTGTWALSDSNPGSVEPCTAFQTFLLSKQPHQGLSI
jgi:hypothetical protein